jgi:hypothetical protein
MELTPKAYPFPAFVLVVPITPLTRPRLLSRDTDITVRLVDEPRSTPPSSSVAWGNEQWFNLTDGRPVGECMEPLMQGSLQDWVESEEEEDAIFTLELKRPATTLQLVKTILPLVPRSNSHAFCIVTSQRQHQSSTPSARSSISTDVSMSTGSGSYFAQAKSSPRSNLSPPLAREARMRSTIGRHSPFAEKPGAFQSIMQTASAECRLALDAVDWSKTKLGPRSTWSDVVDPVLSIVWQSPTDDSVWLGEDLHLI